MEAEEVRSAADHNLLGWHFQATELSQIKNDINDMGQKLFRLELIRGQLTPQQQTATVACVLHRQAVVSIRMGRSAHATFV
jgi:hypothetical protein